MKWTHFVSLTTALVFLAGATQSKAAPNQMVPKGLGDTVTASGLLSFRAPAGWKQDEINGDIQMCGPVSNGWTPDIIVDPGNHGTLTNLKDTYQPVLHDNGASLKIVENKPFVTEAGVKGVRLKEVDATGKVTQYAYIFLSAGGQQIECACACATADAAVYLPVFEASMKTVVIAKDD